MGRAADGDALFASNDGRRISGYHIEMMIKYMRYVCDG